MTTKLRWMTIVVLAVLLSAGPAAALDGARAEKTPAVLAWLMEPLEALWSRVPDRLLGAVAGENDEPVEVRQLNGEENVHAPPLEEAHFLIEPEG